MRSTDGARALPAGDDGFTLIELLVVVVIIGVLAAIAVPVYLAVQYHARDSSVQTDLTNDRYAVVGYRAATGSSAALGPSNFTAATLATYGFVTPTAANYATQLTYAAGSSFSTFCLSAQSASGTYFYATSSHSVVSTTDASVAASCNGSSNW